MKHESKILEALFSYYLAGGETVDFESQ